MKITSNENQSLTHSKTWESLPFSYHEVEENSFFLSPIPMQETLPQFKTYSFKEDNQKCSFNLDLFNLETQNYKIEEDVCQVIINDQNMKIEAIDTLIDTKEQSIFQNLNELQSTESPQKFKTQTLKNKNKKKTTEFAYLLERKSFRMMRKYYKEKFESEIEDSEYKKKLPTMTLEDINLLVSTFMDKEFGTTLLSLLTPSDCLRTRDGLKTIIF